MQCIGYSLQQFRYITVQPLKLYAFHKDTNKLQPIPDLPQSELQKAVDPQTLRWYSLREPLDKIAPLNLSTASPNHPQNHFYRIQLAYTYAEKHLNLLQRLNLTPDQTTTTPIEQTIDNLLERTDQIVQRAIDEIAPYIICQHVEQIAEQTLTWLPAKHWSSSSQQRLTATQNSIKDLVESKLGLTLLPQ